MKNIIVREYLQSLTERDELDYLFPILLEVMDFKIISTPKIKGLAQYGKDVVAIGIDKVDGVRKRFYFEIKGGADKDITSSTYNKSDGIRESIHEMKDRPFRDSSNPQFNFLPVKIVIVHNGDIHPSVKETFDGFIEREFPKVNKKKSGGIFSSIFRTKNNNNPENYEFERWDIYELTNLFATFLFNEYLLTNEDAVRRFKKVLVLIDTPKNNFNDFFQLITSIFNKAGTYKDLPERKRYLLFETLNLTSFIIYSYSKDANNLEVAKKCLPFTVLKLWAWIIENGVENDKKIVEHFQKHLNIFLAMIDEYFVKTIGVAKLKNGLCSPNGGRYEQVGFPYRSLEYVCYQIFSFRCHKIDLVQQQKQVDDLIAVVDNNIDGVCRPLFDNHSIPVCLVIDFLIENNKIDEAKQYLRNVLFSIKIGSETHNRLPDGRNSLENVTRYVVTGKKSVFFEEKTSHLVGYLFKYLAKLNMETEYLEYRSFVTALKLDIADYFPYSDEELLKYLPDNKKSHEVNLFSHELNQEGYQRQIILDEDFKQFQEKIQNDTPFTYSYKTDNVGYKFLRILSHIYFKTPFF